MVTETYNDLNKIYMKHEDWVKYGITNDAMWVGGNQWLQKDYMNRNYHIDIIRNQKQENCYSSMFYPIKPLNKWQL